MGVSYIFAVQIVNNTIMIKIAIPVIEGVLSEIFGECSHYMIYEIKNKVIISKTTEVPPIKTIDKLALWAEDYGITDVIVNNISSNYLSYFSNTKINLFVGVKPNLPEYLIEEYLNGTLQSNANNFTV